MQTAKKVRVYMDLSDSVLIRDVQNSDLTSIVKCHQIVFPDALSTAMGPGYIWKMMEWYITSPKTFLFLIEENKEFIGYCGGMIRDSDGEGSASSMVQHSFWVAVKSLVSRPQLLLHKEVRSKYMFIFRNIRNRFFPRTPPMEVNPRSAFESFAGLVVIGVQPLWQGKGYGTLLLNKFESAVRSRGIKKMQLSVRSGNETAIRAYINNGWSIKKTHDTYTEMEKYIS